MEEFDLDSNRPVTRAFVTDFIQRYGHDPALMGAFGFDAYNLFSAAAAKCNVDTTCIRDFLYAVRNDEGACGVISFDDHGDVVKPLKFKKIRGGKRVDFEEG